MVLVSFNLYEMSVFKAIPVTSIRAIGRRDTEVLQCSKSNSNSKKATYKKYLIYSKCDTKIDSQA